VLNVLPVMSGGGFMAGVLSLGIFQRNRYPVEFKAFRHSQLHIFWAVIAIWQKVCHFKNEQ